MSDRPVFHTLAVDCPDPRALAVFYVDLLGYTLSPGSDDEWVTITGPGPQMSFQLAPDHVPPTWPRKDVPQQAHVDFFVTDVASAHQRVLALGGRAIDPVNPPTPSPSRGFRVYADPAGHPFCLRRPTRDAGDRSRHRLRPGESNRHRGDPGPTHGSATSHYHRNRIR